MLREIRNKSIKKSSRAGVALGSQRKNRDEGGWKVEKINGAIELRGI